VELKGLGLTWWRNNTPSDLVCSDHRQAATLQGMQIIWCYIHFIEVVVGGSELEFLLPVICEELQFGPSIVTIWPASEIVNGELVASGSEIVSIWC
jgi:hypothetical protein